MRPPTWVLVLARAVDRVRRHPDPDRDAGAAMTGVGPSSLGGRGASSHDRRGLAGAARALPRLDRGRVPPARIRAARAAVRRLRGPAAPRARDRRLCRRRARRVRSRVSRRPGCAGTTGSSPRSSWRRSAQGRGVGPALLDAVWSDAALRRRTITDAIQPVSNALYGRRGLIPVTPLLAFSGLPVGAHERLQELDDAQWLARSDRRRRLRVRPLGRPRALAADRETHRLGARRRAGRVQLHVRGRRHGAGRWARPRPTRRTHSSPRSPGPRGR